LFVKEKKNYDFNICTPYFIFGDFILEWKGCYWSAASKSEVPTIVQ
jgi:hypothetical protein